ncbi:MAG: helix-turn-helix domain-containing protein [Gammaproteobacteria bacterium]
MAGGRLAPAALERLGKSISGDDILRILRNLLAMTEQPCCLGLYLGSRLPPGGPRPAGTPAVRPARIAQRRPGRYPGVAPAAPARSTVSLQCLRTPDRFLFELQLPEGLGDAGWLLVEALVITIQRSIELVTGRPLVEAEIDLQQPAPASLTDYTRYLPGQLRFGQPLNRVSVPMTLMTQPNPYGDSAVWEQALALCARLAPPPAGERASLADALRQLLQQEAGRRWTLEEIAEYFHLSPRTVIRRLKAEGVRYQQLLDEVLASQAKLCLRSPGHTVESVAAALGYQDASAFRRAFKRWTGLAPSDWQQRPPH